MSTEHVTQKWWRSLSRRDFDNGAVLDDVDEALGELSRLRAENERLREAANKAKDLASRVHYSGRDEQIIAALDGEPAADEEGALDRPCEEPDRRERPRTGGSPSPDERAFAVFQAARAVAHQTGGQGIPTAELVAAAIEAAELAVRHEEREARDAEFKEFLAQAREVYSGGSGEIARQALEYVRELHAAAIRARGEK